MSLNEEIRRQLVLLARRSDSRHSDSSPSTPTKWQPYLVRKPSPAVDEFFTDREAWEFVATKLAEGHAVEVISLRRPRGKKGYVMKIELEPKRPLLYVKLQLGSGKVIGRSFHYSETR